MSFMPNLFISVGETAAYFTLRETYLHTRYIDGYAHTEVRSFHHFNLSQNAAEAMDKATAVAESLGLPLKASVDTISQEMRDIQRMSQEQQAERQAAIARREEEKREENEARLEGFKESLSNGVIPFGYYNGEKIREVSRSYVSWVLDNEEKFEKGTPMAMLCEAMKKQASDRAYPKADADKFVGKEKQRLEFDVTVVKHFSKLVPSFGRYGQYDLMHIVSMVTSNGESLVSFGKFSAEAGDVLKVKATVKEHTYYQEKAQTVVNRVKVQ